MSHSRASRASVSMGKTWQRGFYPWGSGRRTDFPASECPPGPLTPVDARPPPPPQNCSSPRGSGPVQEDDAHVEKKVRLH